MSYSSREDRPRILLREFRRRRQPKRWDSLPCLHLSPENRPLFVCLRCKFPNPISAVCPWCLTRCDTCDSNKPAQVAAVRRRVSSPTLLSDAQKMQLIRLERRARAVLGVRSGAAFPFLATSSESPGPRSVAVTRDLPDGVSGPHADSDDDVRRKHRNAVLYSATDVVATATADTTLQPFLDQIAAAHQENRERKRRSVHSPIPTTPPLPARKSRPPPIASRPQTPRTPNTLASPTRMSDCNADLKHMSEPRSSPHESSAPPSPISHTPCLRRKRRMSVLRQRSSCSLRRRATTSSASTCCRESAASQPSSPRSKTATSTTSPPASPRAKSATSIRFSTPAPGTHGNAAGPPGTATAHLDSIPLGHPQRPLYTAIRKNMSRPDSPTPNPNPSPNNPSPNLNLNANASVGVGASRASFDASLSVHTVYERGTRSLDIDTSARYGSLTRASHLAIAAQAHPALFASAMSGFSVSGETELRMDLARSRSMDGVPGDFAFREVGQRRKERELERERREGDAGMKTKVKNLGKTLKGLLRTVKI